MSFSFGFFLTMLVTLGLIYWTWGLTGVICTAMFLVLVL